MNGLEKDGEILRLRKIVEEYRRKENKTTASYNKKTDDPDFNEKCLIVKKMNKRFDLDSRRYMFAIWRLKFLLKRTMRLKGKFRTPGQFLHCDFQAPTAQSSNFD